MAEILPCPMCGHAAGDVRELVADRVWSLRCGAGRVNHDASVMSWTSAEHCIEEWNRYATPTGAVQKPKTSLDHFIDDVEAAEKLSAEKFLPKLPEVGYLGDDVSYGYDSTDMRDYALEAVRAALSAMKGDQP